MFLLTVQGILLHLHSHNFVAGDVVWDVMHSLTIVYTDLFRRSKCSTVNMAFS